MILNRGFLLLLLFAFFIFPKVTQHSVYLSPEELYYQSYMETLSGELTPEKENYLLQEQQRLIQAQQEVERIQQLYQDGQITDVQRMQLEQPYQSAITAQTAFSRVLQNYDSLVQQGGGSFVYDTGYLVLFQGNAKLYLGLLLFCILSCSNQFSMERGMNRLLSALPKGRSCLIRCKVLLSLSLCMGATCLAYGMELYSVHQAYGLNQWGASIADIPAFSALPSWLTLWGFAGLSLLLTWIAVGSSILFILLFSAYSKNGLIAMLLSLFLLAAPVVLSLLGLDFFQYLSFFPLTAVGSLLTTDEVIFLGFVYLIVSICCIAVVFPLLLKSQRCFL